MNGIMSYKLYIPVFQKKMDSTSVVLVRTKRNEWPLDKCFIPEQCQNCIYRSFEKCKHSRSFGNYCLDENPENKCFGYYKIKIKGKYNG